MELVYLWVEEYKNIKKQGFNFSPNFDVKFTPVYEDERLSDKSELEITPKENPLKDFFGENINVTAIVGENGSGKSRIFEVLLSILINNEKVNSYLIIVKNHNDDLIQYDPLIVNINDVNKKIKKIEKNYSEKILENYKDVNLLFLTNEYIEETFFEKIKYDSEQSNTIRTYTEKKNINIKILENAIKFTNVKFIKDAKNFFLPTKVKIKIDDIKGIKRLRVDEQKQIEKLKEEAEKCLKNGKYKKYLKKVYDIFEIFIKSDSFPNSVLLKMIDEDYNYEYNEDLSEKYDSFLEKLENKSFEENVFYEFTILDITKETMSFLKSINNYHIFKIELLDNDKSFDSLSYGERQILNQLHLILNQLDLRKTNTFNHTRMNEETDEPDESYENTNIEKHFIFIDEFELGLHPNWQKKALSYLIDFLKVFSIKIDLFITSHSPFILSDLPKENIIFLEKGKQVYPFDDGKQTFGANIHTLLSHGFFMKEGLIGEFAKSKIDDVIKYLNNDIKSTITTDNDAQNIIDIIGEPIIKRELQRMLKNKMELSNKTEIDTIKSQIKLLTDRLKKLEPKDEK